MPPWTYGAVLDDLPEVAILAGPEGLAACAGDREKPLPGVVVCLGTVLLIGGS